MFKFMHNFLRANSGATAIEYTLIAGLVFVAIIAAAQALGASVITVLYTNLESIL
jgi:Flp pilus assembly pilin Flp